jgi:hypothetical protein
MKKLLFLGACLVALASQPVMAQTGGVDVVVVRVFDNGSSVNLVINRGPGKSEKVFFGSGGNDKHLADTAEAYQQLIAKLHQEGYGLKSTFPAVNGLATLVFVKEK